MASGITLQTESRSESTGRRGYDRVGKSDTEVMLASFVSAVDKSISRIEEEDGKFELAVLVPNSSISTLWDLVLSAPWIKGSTLGDFESVSRILSKNLSDSQMTTIGQIAILPRTHGLVDRVVLSQKETLTAKHVRNLRLGDQIVSDAFVLRSRRIKIRKNRHSSRKK
jgi:hypothetical protein